MDRLLRDLRDPRIREELTLFTREILPKNESRIIQVRVIESYLEMVVPARAYEIRCSRKRHTITVNERGQVCFVDHGGYVRLDAMMAEGELQREGGHRGCYLVARLLRYLPSAAELCKKYGKRRSGKMAELHALGLPDELMLNLLRPLATRRAYRSTRRAHSGKDPYAVPFLRSWIKSGYKSYGDQLGSRIGTLITNYNQAFLDKCKRAVARAREERGLAEKEEE